MPINPLPNGTQALIPHLILDDCAKAMDYYKRVFKAEEMMRMAAPGGKKIMHAEMRIAGCVIWMADEHPGMGGKAPKGSSAPPMSLTLYCLDADKVFDRCVKHGAKVVRAMEDAFWGDRMGTIIDPFGYQWSLMQRVEELTPKQMDERGKKAMAAMSKN